ncbi:RYamide receptor [Araneus ventricosus]|uniref:RYamide receptor n=1 Tax=Araneus ventricosus TaxID=182803 RepID=A0A4Y2FJR6_ARAVE|nr:RYamide receptor [Araneus ventricosus]
MMITVVSVFTLCWLPLNALIVAGDEHDVIWQFAHIHYVWFVCHWLAMSSTSYNPIIYCWMNSKYRDGFRQVFVRLLCLPGRKKGFKTSLNRNGFNRYTTNTIYTSIRSSGTHRGSQCSSHRGSIVKGHKSCARTESGAVVLSAEPKENTSLAPNGYSTSNMTDSAV